jgi:predicted transcriptional regulator
MNLKRKIENLEKEAKALVSPLDERVVVVEFPVPIEKSNEVIYEGEEMRERTGENFSDKRELSKAEMSRLIAQNEEKAVKEARRLAKRYEKVLAVVSAWDWKVYGV